MLLMVEKILYFSGMYLISVVFQIVSNGCHGDLMGNHFVVVL